jgi:hypothetical protein
MLVKAIRTGFYNRIRKSGDTFTFSGDKCPTWCVEVKNGKTTTKSKDIKAVDAVSMIGMMQDIDEIREFTEGDKRTSVMGETLRRIEELEL